MAFGIGVNTEHPDRGKWQGRQEDVACDCWFSNTGMTIPRLVKFRDREGVIQSLGHIQVHEMEKIYRCGIPATEYRCSSLYEGVEYRFRLIFHMEDCRWKLIWEN